MRPFSKLNNSPPDPSRLRAQLLLKETHQYARFAICKSTFIFLLLMMSYYDKINNKKQGDHLMKLGYIRVSRDKQTTAFQEDPMRQEQCARTITLQNERQAL